MLTALQAFGLACALLLAGALVLAVCACILAGRISEWELITELAEADTVRRGRVLQNEERKE
jgi:hypothetical protein